MSKKRFEESLATLAPSAVGYREEFPYISPEKVAGDAIAHFSKGGPYVVLVFKISIFLLNLLSLLTQGRMFKNLEREKQDRFLMKCMRSRLMWVRGIALLLKLPLAMHYYGQDEVCSALGYDREELCEDAEKHQVTR